MSFSQGGGSTFSNKIFQKISDIPSMEWGTSLWWFALKLGHSQNIRNLTVFQHRLSLWIPRGRLLYIWRYNPTPQLMCWGPWQGCSVPWEPHQLWRWKDRPRLFVFLSYLCCSANRRQSYSGPDHSPFFPIIYAVPGSEGGGPAPPCAVCGYSCSPALSMHDPMVWWAVLAALSKSSLVSRFIGRWMY